MDETSLPEVPEQNVRKWQPLERHDRRVAGVLVEKAKTTPDNYPLSLNAIVNACNQKSNRFPQMQLDEEQVDAALERLKKVGAVAQIQSDGRVDKYRHLLYDWLGVDKVELAVMAELLLRGAQTLGELRGRAARMESIADIGALRPIVAGLVEKGLIIYLTPPGRGCAVTHALYQPQELAKVQAEYDAGGGNAEDAGEAQAAPIRPKQPPAEGDLVALQEDVAALKAEVAELRARLDQLER